MSREEGASFSGAIAGRPGRPPVFLVVFLVAIAGLALAGLGGRDGGPGSATRTPGVAATAAPAASAPPGASAAPLGPAPTPIAAVGASPLPSPQEAPIVVSEAGRPLALTIRRHPETMFVHGDVYPDGVTWVFLNLVSSEGRVAAWTSVSIPGGAGPRPSGKPALRFDVELALPDWSHGPLWVQATAYDGTGLVVAQEQLGVWPDGSPMVGSHDRIDVDGPPMLPAPDATTLAAEPVRLEAPALGATIGETTVSVRGRLQVKADSIEITLLTADRRVLASRTIRTANLDGGIRPVRAPTFDIRLGIGEPRRTGAAWVVITAFDETGAAVGFQRHLITIGELERPGPW